MMRNEQNEVEKEEKKEEKKFYSVSTRNTFVTFKVDPMFTNKQATK